MPTYWIFPVHFNIGFFISHRISQSILILFWCLLTSVIFNQYTMYHGLPPCNFKNIEATLTSHWFSPVMYRVSYFHVCTHILVSTNRTITTFNFTHSVFHVIIYPLNIFSLSLSHIFSFNFIYRSVHLKIFNMVLK